ncbi:MAG: chemotaxis protein CheC [Candidatus Omnitrophota bacterium]
MKKVKIDADFIDMLKEVGNICIGNAAVALSQVLNQKIGLSIPGLKIIDRDKLISELKDIPDILVGIRMQLLSNLTGNILLIFPEKSAYSLIDTVCSEQNKDNLGTKTEYGVSLLKEIGNIVISAYLGTLSSLSKKVILHSTPSLICGTLETVCNIAFNEVLQDEVQIILLETFFEIERKNIKGSFFIMFSPNNVKEFLEGSLK